MSSPNITPLHSRQSTMDFDRRHSKSSFHEPSTPTHHSHASFGNSDGLDEFGSGPLGGSGGGNGLGNLADELADALSDGDEDEEGYYDEDEGGEGGDGDGIDGIDGRDGRDGVESIDGIHESNAATLARHGAAPPGISLSEVEGDDTRPRDSANGQRDSGVDVASASSSGAAGGSGHGHKAGNESLSLPAGGASGGRRGHHHKRADSVYDGSEYGSDSDLDSPGMPPSLVAKMDAVESLARRGTEENGGPTDGVCRRLIDELRDLGSQANVEGGASRLITAHSALTTHLAHQTRQLHALTFPLFSPLAMSPLMMGGSSSLFSAMNSTGNPVSIAGGGGNSISSKRVVIGGGGGGGVTMGGSHADSENGDDSHGDGDGDDDGDSFSPMLAALADQMPRPSTAAYQSLVALHGLTGDLVATLSYLSDTLHMARQTTTTATRRLRSAKELVAEMRRDEELREEGERWLARGNWDERLRRRECAHVCGEVVGGFEEVCNGWRARLLAQAESAQA